VNQQGPTHEEHHGHRNLGDDEGAANAVTDLPLAQQVGIAMSRLLERWEETE
jgi:hypothetical protein